MATTILGKVGLTPKGAWAEGTTYERLDVVSNGGSSYMSLQDNNTAALTDTSKWQVLADASAAITTEAAEAIANAETATTESIAATTESKASTAKADEATAKATTATANADAATTAAKEQTALAKTATDNANTAKDNAVEATTATQTATADLKTWLGSILPTGLVVKCLTWITKGNLAEKRIDAILTPDNATKNIIYLSDNKSVAVDPFGRISVVGTGKSTVHVIPTMNTALAKTVIIEVGEPSLRMTSQTSMRFTSTGALRFN